MKVDNERILELNQILLDKIHNTGKDKRNEYEIDYETVSYKHKGKKLKFSDSESSSGVKVRSHRERYLNTQVKVVKVTVNLEKGSINIMKKSQENLKDKTSHV